MMEKPRFPNSATIRVPERLVLRGGKWKIINLAVRYGVFNHPVAGRCLVDTGYSRRVTQGPRSRILRLYNAILRPQLTKMALPDAEPDIDTILVTHIHADHVSALKDYPNAVIYADTKALRKFMAASAFNQNRHGVFGELIPEDILSRVRPFSSCKMVLAPYGLGDAYDVFGDGSVLAVPLLGHMDGHFGIVWADCQPPLLYAVDVEWLAVALNEDRSPKAPARWVLHDRRAAQNSARRVRDFKNAGGHVVLCHDPNPVT